MVFVNLFFVCLAFLFVCLFLFVYWDGGGFVAVCVFSECFVCFCFLRGMEGCRGLFVVVVVAFARFLCVLFLLLLSFCGDRYYDSNEYLSAFLLIVT